MSERTFVLTFMVNPSIDYETFADELLKVDGSLVLFRFAAGINLSTIDAIRKAKSMAEALDLMDAQIKSIDPDIDGIFVCSTESESSKAYIVNYYERIDPTIDVRALMDEPDFPAPVKDFRHKTAYEDYPDEAIFYDFAELVEYIKSDKLTPADIADVIAYNESKGRYNLLPGDGKNE